MIIDAPTLTDIPALRYLWTEAFGDGEAFLDLFFGTAFAPIRCRCIKDGEHVAAALYWFDCLYEGDPIAYIYAVATSKDYRGKGLCSSLMSDTHSHLSDRGYVGAILVPGEKGLFSMYEKMGYRVCSKIGELRCSASDTPVSVRRINADEYAKQRRELLPQGSVIQEKENLAFLETQTELYSGDGFLLAARRGNKKLFGAELLGDTSKASGILKALCCNEGVFRVPHEQRDFSMYIALSDKSPAPPAYFGLAFD